MADPQQVTPSSNIYLNAIQWGGWRWNDASAREKVGDRVFGTGYLFGTGLRCIWFWEGGRLGLYLTAASRGSLLRGRFFRTT